MEVKNSRVMVNHKLHNCFEVVQDVLEKLPYNIILLLCNFHLMAAEVDNIAWVGPGKFVDLVNDFIVRY